MRTFTTNPFDWFNYIAQNSNSNALIQYILQFDSQLCFETLKKALSSCLVADPVMSCVFSLDSELPQWVEVKPDLNSICKLIIAEPNDIEIDSFLTERIYAEKECPVKIALIMGKNRCSLVVKLHHAVCDAAGGLQFVRLLANMYTEISGNKSFTPISIEPKRDTDDFYSYFDVVNKKSRLNMTLLPNMQSTWGTPTVDNTSTQLFAYKLARFDNSITNRIKQFAKEHESSLNTVLTIAYHCALVEQLKVSEPIKEIQFTANLRGYSNNPTPNSICNLSNTFNVQLPTQGSIVELAKRCKQLIDRAIEPETVLQYMLACELMSTDYKALETVYNADWENIKKTGLCTPMISNVGRLDTQPIAFANLKPSDMYVVSPAFVGPSFMLSVSSFENIITLCVAYQKPSTSDEFVSSLLESMSRIINSIALYP